MGGRPTGNRQDQRQETGLFRSWLRFPKVACLRALLEAAESERVVASRSPVSIPKTRLRGLDPVWRYGRHYDARGSSTEVSPCM